MLLLSIAWFWQPHIVCPMIQLPFFLFLVEKKIDLVLSSPNWMLNLSSTNQSHILGRFFVSSFIRSKSLCKITNMYILVYSRSNNGPRMNPCGSQYHKSTDVENLSRTLIWSFPLDRYDLHQSITSRKKRNDEF